MYYRSVYDANSVTPTVFVLRYHLHFRLLVSSFQTSTSLGIKKVALKLRRWQKLLLKFEHPTHLQRAPTNLTEAKRNQSEERDVPEETVSSQIYLENERQFVYTGITDDGIWVKHIWSNVFVACKSNIGKQVISLLYSSLSSAYKNLQTIIMEFPNDSGRDYTSWTLLNTFFLRCFKWAFGALPNAAIIDCIATKNVKIFRGKLTFP